MIQGEISTVWTGNEIDIIIYQYNDETGTVIGMQSYPYVTPGDDAPEFVLCFTQDISVFATHDATRSPATGKRAKRITSLDKEYTASCTAFYTSATDFYNAQMWLKSNRFALVWYGRSGVSGARHSYPTEQHMLLCAVLKDSDIKSQDNTNVTVSLSFWAEDYLVIVL